MVCNVGDDSFLQIGLWGAKTEGYSLRIGGGGGIFFEGGKGVIIIIICHSGLNKIAMGGHFFKKKTKCKKICLPHNYVSLLLVFF